jgi:hypothetical protein
MNDMDRSLKILNFDLMIALTQTVITKEGHVAEIRKLVTKVDNLKIEIYPNEHPPPHFHVKSNDFNVSLSIMDCDIVKGQLDSKTLKKVKYFHGRNKDKLISIWNELRPSNCPVGPIRN